MYQDSHDESKVVGAKSSNLVGQFLFRKRIAHKFWVNQPRSKAFVQKTLII
jgi:hypothetical protein